MGRKVVEGGPIRFKDDLPIREAAIPEPLGLAVGELAPEVLTVWYKRRYFELERSAGESRARIWSREYALVERASARAREDAFVHAHAAQVEQARQAWLGRVLGGADPATAASWGAQAADVIAEKIAALCPLRTRPPQREVGKGKVTLAREESALCALQGFDRLLLVDSKVYELLTLGEYLTRFERAFDPALFKELQEACETVSPAELCQLMSASRDRMDKRTFGVIRGKVHFDRRTFELLLDGVYFIPEFLARRDELVSWYQASLERTLKLGVLDRLRR